MSDDRVTRLNTRLTNDHAALVEAITATDDEPFAILNLDGRSMLEIAAAQIRYALESDEPSAAMRTTLTTAQNALDRVCRNCAGERWEDAEDGGRCINCGTPHHGMAALEAEGRP